MAFSHVVRHEPGTDKTIIHLTPGNFPPNQGPNCPFGESVVTVVVHGPDGKDTAIHLTVLDSGGPWVRVTVANRADVIRRIRLRPWKLAADARQGAGGAR